MARKLILICDQCKLERTISDSIGPSYEDKRIVDLARLLPDSWRTVHVDFGNTGGRAEAVVCSFDCSARWVYTQLKANMSNAELQGYYMELTT